MAIWCGSKGLGRISQHFLVGLLAKLGKELYDASSGLLEIFWGMFLPAGAKGIEEICQFVFREFSQAKVKPSHYYGVVVAVALEPHIVWLQFSVTPFLVVPDYAMELLTGLPVSFFVLLHKLRERYSRPVPAEPREHEVAH